MPLNPDDNAEELRKLAADVRKNAGTEERRGPTPRGHDHVAPHQDGSTAKAGRTRGKGDPEGPRRSGGWTR